MKRLIIKFGFSNRSESKTLVFARQIIARMTGNTNFPNATDLIAILLTATDDFATALEDISLKTVGTTAAKNAALATLKQALVLVASHVEDNSAGNLAILQSSGFEARKLGLQRPIVVLGLPTDILLTQQKGGNLHFKLKKAANSIAMEIRHRAIGEDTWSDSHFATGSECTISGFVAGTQYEVQTRAIGKGKAKEVAEVTHWEMKSFWAI
jgi:hypothetical protein